MKIVVHTLGKVLAWCNRRGQLTSVSTCRACCSDNVRMYRKSHAGEYTNMRGAWGESSLQVSPDTEGVAEAAADHSR